MERHLLRCTFCKRSEQQVRKLVAGPGVYICDRCTERAHAIIHEETTSPTPPSILQRVRSWLRPVPRRARKIELRRVGWETI
jgi:ATP-dependent protease Clp ATPase subunit